MTIHDDAVARIKARVIEVEALARRLYPQYAAHPSPSVEFIHKGLRGGDCHYSRNRYRFNVGLAIQTDAIERNTVPHEVAHMVSYKVFGNRGHGKGWKAICLALGGNGERCFDPDKLGVRMVKARTATEYQYITASGHEVWLSAVRHNRLQKLGDKMHPVNGRPLYALTGKVCGPIKKSAFSGKTRKKG